MAARSSFAVARRGRGQDRVAAGDQPLAGEVFEVDLGETLLVEEAELQRPSSAISLRWPGAQRVDPLVGVRVRPPVPSWPGSWPGSGARDHAAVPDHDHLGQPELVPDHRDDLGDAPGRRVAGHPDRDWPPGRS